MSSGSTPRKLSDRAVNFAREFLSALFMSLRTAQIHDPGNNAYQSALTRLHQAADALFAASGGFEVRIVDESFYVNGTRLPFDPGSATAMRTLRELIEAQSLGGFSIESAPTVQGLLELIALIADRAGRETTGQEEELRRLNIGVLGPQRVVEEATTRVDRGTFAVHTYAKLILAIRDRVRQIAGEPPESHAVGSGEIKAVRVVQDLVELFSERIDLMLRLATNIDGANPEELHGANTCLLSIAMGHTLGFHRRDLGDIGTVALFHHLGPLIVGNDPRHHDLQASAALSRTLAESGAGNSLFTRAMIMAEQLSSAGTSPRTPHPFSRVLRVAAAYNRMVLGYGVAGGGAVAPVDALASMRRDSSGWLDPNSVDLLINLLRVYPPGVQVLLQSGRYAVVSSPLNARLDRPLVRVATRPPQTIDLMAQQEGEFVDQIVGTQRLLGAAPAQGQATNAPATGGIPVRDRPPVPVSSHDAPTTAEAPTVGAGFDPSGSVPLSPYHPVPRMPPPRPAATGPITSMPAPPPIPPAAQPLDLAGTKPVTREHTPFTLGAPEPDPIAPASTDRSTSEPPRPSAPPMQPAPPMQSVPPMPSGPPPMQSGPPMHPGADAQRSPGPLDEPAPIVPSGNGSTGSQSGASTRFGNPRPDRLLGSFLAGKYRILEKIGEGGMGTVFLANQEPIDRQVAIKVLHHSLTNDEVAVRRFEREARVISRMRHPNTVTVYDFGRTQAEELYLVMEFLEGQTVAQLVRAGGPLPGLRGARIIRQACGSLSEAHELGIIHRDLKPDNIFLTRFGDQQDFVKVLDFGLVKLADNDSVHQLTQAGKVYGTPRYMAPEQAEGKPIDHRSDIYTLGVVLYELLMGRPLFVAETMVALLVKHIQQPPPPMAAVRPDLDVDPRLESIVMWALAKKPEDRPQSVKELARELERWEQEAQASMTASAFAAPSVAAPNFVPPPPEVNTWTKGAAVDDLSGHSLNSMLEDFLQELTPLGQVDSSDDEES